MPYLAIDVRLDLGRQLAVHVERAARRGAHHEEGDGDHQEQGRDRDQQAPEPMKREHGGEERSPTRAPCRRGRPLRNFHPPPMMSTKGPPCRTRERRMTDFRRVTDDFAVAPQISRGRRGRGRRARASRLIINNRPDGEAPGPADRARRSRPPPSAAGLAYLHIPVRGGPTPAQVEAARRRCCEADGPVLAFCRSGTRSIITWSLGQAMSGARAARRAGRPGPRRRLRPVGRARAEGRMRDPHAGAGPAGRRVWQHGRRPAAPDARQSSAAADRLEPF